MNKINKGVNQNLPPGKGARAEAKSIKELTPSEAKSQEVAQYLFSSKLLLPKEKGVFGGFSIDNGFTVQNEIDAAQNVVADPQVSIGEGQSTANHIFGGSMASLTLAIRAEKLTTGLKRIEKQEFIGDERSLLLSKFNLVKDSASFVGGINSIAKHSLAFADIIQNHGVSLVGRVSRVSTTLGAILSMIFCVALAVIRGISLHELGQVRGGINQEDLSKALEYLKEEFSVNSDAIKALDKEILEGEALELAKICLRELCSESGMKLPTEEEIEGILTGLAKDAGINLKDVGIKVRAQKEQLKIDAKIGRVFGRRGKVALNELLDSKINAQDPSALTDGQKELIGTVQKSVRNKMILKGLFIGGSILGIASIISGVIATAGAGAIVAGVIGLLASLGVLAVDGHGLVQNYLDGQPMGQDRRFVIGQMVLVALSFIVILALGLSGVVTMGTGPLIISAIITAICLAQSGATLGVMNRNEKRFRDENPSLERVLDLFERGSERRFEIFKNLPQEVRDQIDTRQNKLHIDRNQSKTTIEVLREMVQGVNAHITPSEFAAKA